MTRIGFYPGSFDPVTNGHIDIARRATKLVDRLVVGVGTHHDKRALFTADERVSLVVDALRPVADETGAQFDVTTFDTLTVTAAHEVGARVIIRGLRDAGDFDYEMQMAGMNAAMLPDVETVFLASSPETRYIAASLVRQIAAMGGDVSSFVPAKVAESLKEEIFRMMLTRTLVVGAMLLALGAAASRSACAADPLDNVLLLDLKDGPVTILLRPDLAPKHVERVKKLTREGFYDGIVFHRVIPGFMAQTGDPTGTGTGGSSYPDLPAEFTNKATFVRGTIGTARSNDPNSANSQFFIDVRCRVLPQRQIHGLGPGDRRHGRRRQDQAGRAAGESPTRSSRCRLPPMPTMRRSRQRPKCSRPSNRRPTWQTPENTLILETSRGPVTSSSGPTSPRTTSPASRSWRARASMTAWCSTASSTASWRRPAIRPAPAPAARARS